MTGVARGGGGGWWVASGEAWWALQSSLLKAGLDSGSLLVHPCSSVERRAEPGMRAWQRDMVSTPSRQCAALEEAGA